LYKTLQSGKLYAKYGRYPARVGQLISHFTGPRFKPVRIIDKQPCTYVDSIFILEDGSVWIANNYTISQHEASIVLNFLIKEPAVQILKSEACYVNDIKLNKLNETEKDLLAWHDGFRHTDKQFANGCFSIMFTWWKQTHQLPFAAHIIKW